METHMNLRRRQHMVLECIPLPRELGDMAPIYFKVCVWHGSSMGIVRFDLRYMFQWYIYFLLQKAIMECDEEWAMNKKIVDLSSKDIRQSVRLLYLYILYYILLYCNDVFLGPSRSAIFCRGLWTTGRVRPCYWKWTEISLLLRQGQSLVMPSTCSVLYSPPLATCRIFCLILKIYKIFHLF